jgi:hypothetical protein
MRWTALEPFAAPLAAAPPDCHITVTVSINVS